MIFVSRDMFLESRKYEFCLKGKLIVSFCWSFIGTKYIYIYEIVCTVADYMIQSL